MPRKKLMGLILSGFIVLLDLGTKAIIEHHLSLGQSLVLVPNFFSLTYVQNQGAAWSLLSGHTLLLGLASFLAATFLLYFYLTKDHSLTLALGLVLMIGGTLGNMVDRLWLGYVRDFLAFRFFGYHYPVFNVADMALVAGCALLVFDLTKEAWHEKNR